MESELLTSASLAIPPEDWAVTPPSVRQALLQILQRLTAVEEEVGRLRTENELLREQTQRSSRNSSQPPSTDGPAQPARPPRQPSGKKRGAQPGHEGHQRKLYPPEACRRLSEQHPAQCRSCGTALSGSDPAPWRHQVVELPASHPLVDEYRLHQLTCPACGVSTRASLPPGVPLCGYGPRLAAAVGALTGPYRQSERLAQAMLADFFEIELALGTVNELRQEVAAAVAEAVQAATLFAQAQQLANADETGWRQGNSDGANPQRRKYWLWVLVTTWVTVFQIHATRGVVAAHSLLGKFDGYLTTDRWTGYNWWPLAQRQLCWAHLLREFEKFSGRDAASRRVGEGLLEQSRALFALWGRVRDGTLSRSDFAAAVVEIRAAIKTWLTEGATYAVTRGDKSVRAKTARTCSELLKVEAALWLFVRVAGVEPTNNAAERALRPAVIWRRTSLGTQSAVGSAFVARMLTVTQTLRAQKRNVLAYLTAACEAARQGEPAPSLLPDVALLEQEHCLPVAAYA